MRRDFGPAASATSSLAAPGRARAGAQPADTVIAITGTSSFLGRNLVGLLEEDDRVARVLSLDIARPPTAGRKTRLYEVDLAEPAAQTRLGEILEAEGVQALLHLALLTSPTRAAGDSHELESVGTMHVLNAARRAGVRKIVLRSHTMLYGAHPTNPNFLTEEHPLRCRRSESFFKDKVDAERETLAYARPGDGRVVTVLRTATILGPTVSNFFTRYLSRRMVPTVLGFDPLMQFVHEVDAVTAFKLALDRDTPGVFNIVGEGVLPLSTIIKLAGRLALPLPRSLANPLVGSLWLARLAEAPPAFLDYLQYLCVADGARAARLMGFTPAYTSREALIDYASAQHLRDVRLLPEASP